MANRDLGVQALQLWFNNTTLSMAGTSFDDVVSFYDQNHPTFLENFGTSVKIADLTQDRLSLALQSIPTPPDGQLPAYDEFFQALEGEVTTFRYEDFKKVAAQTISDTVSTVEKAAAVGIGVYALYLIGGLVVLHYLDKMEAAA